MILLNAEFFRQGITGRDIPKSNMAHLNNERSGEKEEDLSIKISLPTLSDNSYSSDESGLDLKLGSVDGELRKDDPMGSLIAGNAPNKHSSKLMKDRLPGKADDTMSQRQSTPEGTED